MLMYDWGRVRKTSILHPPGILVIAAPATMNHSSRWLPASTTALTDKRLIAPALFISALISLYNHSASPAPRNRSRIFRAWLTSPGKLFCCVKLSVACSLVNHQKKYLMKKKVLFERRSEKRVSAAQTESEHFRMGISFLGLVFTISPRLVSALLKVNFCFIAHHTVLRFGALISLLTRFSSDNPIDLTTCHTGTAWLNVYTRWRWQNS